MKRVFSLIFSHLILKVNGTSNYKPLKGLVTGNLNLSLEMVMQMGRFSLWKKFSGFRRWGVLRYL